MLPLYVNFTFVSFSWFLLLRHLPHPFCAIFHSPLPLKKRLRTQELKPLTPPQRFKHCEQPWKVMHCQHDYLESLQSLLAPVLSWFFFPEFLWLCPVSLSAGGLVAPGSLFRIATIPFNTKTVNYRYSNRPVKNTTLKCMEYCQTYYLFLTLLFLWTGLKFSQWTSYSYKYFEAVTYENWYGREI